MGYKGKKPCCPTCGQPIAPSHAKALGQEEKPEFVAVVGTVTKTRDKAVLYACASIGGVAMDVWIPRSQIREGDAVREGVTLLMVKPWFVEKESMRHGA